MERCPHRGGQALGCVGFNPNDPRREPWTGKWPGEADCERFGFFVTGDRSGDSRESKGVKSCPRAGCGKSACPVR